MYRSQYPDAPNLFTNIRRPYRPDVWTEFSRTWLISIIGIALVVTGIVTLVYNERRAVTTAQALDEGQRKILVPETIDVVFEENKGKLVLITGALNIEDNLEDAVYGINIRAVKLKKLVQMYQWYETADHKDTPEGEHDAHVETTYSYAKEWFDSRIDSEAFYNPLGHHNPENWPHNSSLTVNQRVKIGGFLLGQQLKQNSKTTLPSPVMNVQRIQASKCMQGFTFMLRMYGSRRSATFVFIFPMQEKTVIWLQWLANSQEGKSDLSKQKQEKNYSSYILECENPTKFLIMSMPKIGYKLGFIAYWVGLPCF